MDFESFLKGEMSIEEMVAGFEETVTATVGMLLQKQIEPQDTSSGFQRILQKLQGFGAAIDACIDEADEDSDVIFIDMYGGDASFKEV